MMVLTHPISVLKFEALSIEQAILKEELTLDAIPALANNPQMTAQKNNIVSMLGTHRRRLDEVKKAIELLDKKHSGMTFSTSGEN